MEKRIEEIKVDSKKNEVMDSIKKAATVSVCIAVGSFLQDIGIKLCAIAMDMGEQNKSKEMGMESIDRNRI